MTTAADQFLDQVVSSKLSQRGDNFRDGDYELVLKRALFNEGFKGTSLIFEFLVLSSARVQVDPKMLRVGEKAEDCLPNGEGSTVSTVYKMDTKQQKEIASAAMLQIAAALFGWSKDYAESEASRAERLGKCKDLLGTPGGHDGSKFAGQPVKCSTYRAATREKKDIQIRQRWSHMNATPEDIAALRVTVLGG